MTVTNIVARMYDAGSVEAKSSTKSCVKGFDEVMSATVQEQCDDAVGQTCIRADPPRGASVDPEDAVISNVTASSNDGSAAVAGESAVAADSSVTATTVSSSAVSEVTTEVQQSAMYRFTMFIRISGDFGAVQESLIDEFKTATKSFVSALKGDATSGVNALDGYLNGADDAASKGFQSSKSFLDSILAAADQGLKALTASMTSSSWMSGLNLLSSSSSSSLTSVGPMDIAKLQLQDALQKASANSAVNATATATSAGSSARVGYGGGRSLELINSEADPVLVDSAGNAAGETVASKSAADKDIVAAEAQSAQGDGAIALRNSILDRFLQLLDGLSSSLDAGSSIVKAKFSFEYSSNAIRENVESGRVVGNSSVSDEKTVETAAESATAAVGVAEEVIA